MSERTTVCGTDRGGVSPSLPLPRMSRYCFLCGSTSSRLSSRLSLFAGIYLKNTTQLSFTAATFTDNVAQLQGGALFMVNASAIAFDNCTFTNNTAEGGSGGAMLIQHVRHSRWDC